MHTGEEKLVVKTISMIQLIRRVTLGILLVGMMLLVFLHQKMQGIPAIDALDPCGGLETLMKFVAGGEFVRRIDPETL